MSRGFPNRSDKFERRMAKVQKQKSKHLIKKRSKQELQSLQLEIAILKEQLKVLKSEETKKYDSLRAQFDKKLADLTEKRNVIISDEEIFHRLTKNHGFGEKAAREASEMVGPGDYEAALSIAQKLVREEELRLEKVRAKEMARKDKLTGIGNLMCFEEALEQGLVKEQKLGLIYVDIDNFKPMNDTHGHAYGDEVLVMLAKILQEACTQKRQWAFRIGGDEFAVLLANWDERVCTRLAKRIQALLKKKSKSMRTNVTVSIGISAADGPVSSEILRAAADEALYMSKVTKNAINFKKAEAVCAVTPLMNREVSDKSSVYSHNTPAQFCSKTPDTPSSPFFWDSKVCVICRERDRTHALIPCGHKSYCSKCSKEVLKKSAECAVCRKRALSAYRIYD